MLGLGVILLFGMVRSHVTELDMDLYANHRPFIKCDDTKTDNTFFSYHIHVLYWQKSENSTSMAMDLRQRFTDEFQAKECPENVDSGDAAPYQHTICWWKPDEQPAGPFLTAQYAFFIPKGYERFGETVHWIMQRRGSLDTFIHPNSGCEKLDHTEWGLWGGNKWELDASIFSH